MTKKVTLAAGLLLILASSLPACAADGDTEFMLTITGPANAIYAGSCRAVSAAGQETVLPLSGAPPSRQLLIGKHLDCQLRQDSPDGYLAVEAVHGTSVSRSMTRGAGSTITFSLQ